MSVGLSIFFQFNYALHLCHQPGRANAVNVSLLHSKVFSLQRDRQWSK